LCIRLVNLEKSLLENCVYIQLDSSAHEIQELTTTIALYMSLSVCWKTHRIPAEVGFWDPITDTLMHTVEEIAIATRQRYAPALVIILCATLSISSILGPGCNTHTCHSALLLQYPDSMP
jgi:hypothetical protein